MPGDVNTSNLTVFTRIMLMMARCTHLTVLLSATWRMISHTPTMERTGSLRFVVLFLLWKFFVGALEFINLIVLALDRMLSSTSYCTMFYFQLFIVYPSREQQKLKTLNPVMSNWRWGWGHFLNSINWENSGKNEINSTNVWTGLALQWEKEARRWQVYASWRCCCHCKRLILRIRFFFFFFYQMLVIFYWYNR